MQTTCAYAAQATEQNTAAADDEESQAPADDDAPAPILLGESSEEQPADAEQPQPTPDSEAETSEQPEPTPQDEPEEEAAAEEEGEQPVVPPGMRPPQEPPEELVKPNPRPAEEPNGAEKTQYREMRVTGQITDRDVFEKVVRWKVYRMTWEDERQNLATWKRDLINDSFTSRGDFKDAYNRMLARLLPDLFYDQPIRVRINAMLVLTSLNEVEERGLRPARPLPEAVPLLVAEIKSPKQIEAMRYLAVNGLARWQNAGEIPSVHAQLEAARTLVDLLQENDRCHPWIRRKAVVALGAIGRPNLTLVRGEGKVIRVLLDLMADPEADWDERANAAVAIGRMRIRPPQRLNFQLVAHRIVALAAEMAQAYVEAPDDPRWPQRFALLVQTFSGDRRHPGEGILNQLNDQGDVAWVANHRDKVQEAYSNILNVAVLIVDLGLSPEEIEQQLEKVRDWLKANAPEDQDLIVQQPEPEPAASSVRTVWSAA